MNVELPEGTPQEQNKKSEDVKGTISIDFPC